MPEYREKVIELCKIAGLELIDRADQLIPSTQGIKDVNIWIRIPSLSDDPYNIPEIEVNTTIYPSNKALNNIFNLKSGLDND